MSTSVPAEVRFASGIAGTSIIQGSVWRDRDGDRLRSADERAGANRTVFLDTNENSRLDSGDPTAVTGKRGRYAFTGLAPGSYRVGIVAPAQTVQSFPAPPSEFDISLMTPEPLDQGNRAIIRAAADRWQEMIIGDLKDTRGGIDDLQLILRVEENDGPDGTLAFTTIDRRRAVGQGLPFSLHPSQATITFDAADFDDIADDELLTLSLHEIAHALGFGTLWEESTRKIASGLTRSNPRFLGRRAVSIYSRLRNDPALSSVPIENQFGDGTRDLHWRSTDSLLGDELMNGFVVAGAPLSAVTVASIEDLGYVVNLPASDPIEGFRAPPGSDVSVVRPDGAAAGFFDITLGAGEQIALDFAHTALTTLKGAVVRDSVSNRRLDPGDTPLAGRRVYLDLDYDGKLDGFEPSVLTGSKGRYVFNDLPPGIYSIHRTYSAIVQPLAGTPVRHVFVVLLGDPSFTGHFFDLA